MGRDSLSENELERYARQIFLPQVGEKGQLKLKESSVLIVGLGGLGSSIALLMAGTGIGTLGLLDDDIVKLGNLPRQVLYTTADIGEFKAAAAKKRLTQRNPEVSFRVHQQKLTLENAEEIIRDYDLIMDGSDNLFTRRVINQTCVAVGKPYVYGAANNFDGMISVFCIKEGPCFNCLFPQGETREHAYDEDLSGVLSTLPTTVSAIQSTEAIKMITGIGKPLIGRLQIFNGLIGEFHTIEIKKNPHCAVCGDPKHA